MACCRDSDHFKENGLLKCKAPHLLTRQHSFKKSPPVNSHNKLPDADPTALPGWWKIKHKSRHVAPWLNPLRAPECFHRAGASWVSAALSINVLLQLLKLDFIPSVALTQSAQQTADCFSERHRAPGFFSESPAAATVIYRLVKVALWLKPSRGPALQDSLGACNVFSLRAFCGFTWFRSCLSHSPRRQRLASANLKF